MKNCVTNQKPSSTQAWISRKRMKNPKMISAVDPRARDRERGTRPSRRRSRPTRRHRHGAGRIGGDVGEPSPPARPRGRRSTIRDRAEAVLDVVAEHPEEQHVAAEVEQPGVQEHRVRAPRGRRTCREMAALGLRSSHDASASPLLKVASSSLMVSGRPCTTSHGMAAFSYGELVGLGVSPVSERCLMAARRSTSRRRRRPTRS